MRLNLPVVEQEYPFPEGASLVSTTDIKGRILYCNPAFIQVSGYSREALLGQPHNMIRHPDMPEEAFRDMWDTISSGKPWSALVKNRREDGRYYWVQANVTPLIEAGTPTGYMSVRTMPDRAEIKAAQALYSTMRAEKQAGKIVHKLHNGRLITDTPFERLTARVRLGVVGQFTLLSAMLVLVGAGCGLWIGKHTSPLSLWGMMGSLAVLVLCTATARAVFVHLAVSPMEVLLRICNRMAAGDLTGTIASHRSDVIGELTRALNQLQVNLFAIVRDARTQVDQMHVATQEIAAGNMDLSGRTEAQAGSLQETAASMEQITGTVRNGAATAQEAASLARQTTIMAERSGAAVQELSQTMQAIEASSSRINDIIQVIDGIAFQTNILALNAAVEAARAGDEGRGFAVVAAEVRALAQRTATAAKEVKQLITDSSEKVRMGCALTSTVGQSMSEAIRSVDQVGTLVDAISHGASEQLAGISQVNQAVAHLDGITQQNAAAVEEIAAASASLASRAKVVSDAVQVFRIGGHGRESARDAL